MIATIPVRPPLRQGRPGRPPAPAPRRQPPAVYRRRRLVGLGALAAAALAVLVSVEGAFGSPAGLGRTEDVAAHVVVVRPGDTLWSIAAASRPRGDIRSLVDELATEVHGRPLQVGERITVP